MERVIDIINIITVVVLLIFDSTIFGQFKSNSMSLKLTQLVLATMLFILQIPILILEILLNQSCGITIFLICLWALEVAWISFNIRKKMR